MKTLLSNGTMWRSLIGAFILFASPALLADSSAAHTSQVKPVIVVLRPQPSFLTVQIQGNGEDIVQAVKVKDAERIGNTDFTPAVGQRFEAYLNRKLSLQQGQQQLAGKLIKLEYSRPDNRDYTKSEFKVTLRYDRAPKLSGQPFTIRSNLFDYLPDARTYVSLGGVQREAPHGQTLTFDPSQVTKNLLTNIYEFGVLGMEHIFKGPDHILFVLALLVASTAFWPLVKTLSGFTLAHSLTLILAAVAPRYALPESIVNILIPASIIYVGLENIYLKNFKHRFWVASAFGLVHGFAFAGNLRDIGLPDEGLVWCLLSFNLGVEIGQVVICAVAFPLVLLLRKKYQQEEQLGGTSWERTQKVISWAIVAVGGYWLAQQALGA